MSKSIRNIGILAHVDAGKTSITENMLFLCGKTKFVGSVDDGTTQTDFLEVERQRGISVKSSLTSLEWKATQINLVDTPGHVDFSADVERVLQVIDAAVLVISAVEGVQAHTETIWTALQKRQVPVIIFVNKIDRIGADPERVLAEIQKELTEQVVPLQRVTEEGTDTAMMHPLVLSEEEAILEKLANVNDDILDLYLEEQTIPTSLFQTTFKTAIQEAKLLPVLFGSAKMQRGVTELLDAIIEYLPTPIIQSEKDLSAMVYSIYHDRKAGKIAYVRIFNGLLKNREVITNHTQQKEEKITQLRHTFSNQFTDVQEVKAGEIVGICGLTEVRVGDILGTPSPQIPPSIPLHHPLLTVEVKAQKDSDYPNLAKALQELTVEDPALELEWYRDEKRLLIKIMGKIQIEVIEQILEQRFKIPAIFEAPTVIYRETPTSSAYGLGHYTMPKPCWAIVRFLIEPAERGSGVQYESKIRTSDVHQKYQNEVERTIDKALKQGIKGWQVTDLKITLVEGEDHVMHSRPGNFALATPMGIMNGLVETGTTFLEPLISFKITAADNLLGKITSEIIQMRGTFDSPIIENEKMTLTGILPVASSLDFPVWLSSVSSGKAKMLTQFHGYQDCPDQLGQERDFIGISPLDRSKYILKMRKALQ